MRIGAVVLHYRHWPDMRLVMEALLGGDRRPDMTVVVDNDSADGSADAIAASMPEVDLVASPSNLGYAGGMNLGMQRLLDAGMEAVLLLTHDCVLAPDALLHLETRLQEAPHLAVVGPVTGHTSRPDVVFAAGCSLDRVTWETVLGADPGAMSEWGGRAPAACQWVTGSCLLVRATAIRQAGPIDERFFLYFEEVDYQLRLGRLGWGVECVPAARAWQEPGFIPLELWVRNRLLLLSRHAPARVLAREFGRQFRLAAADLGRRRPALFGARTRGVSRFVLRRWGPVRAAGPGRQVRRP